MLNPKDIKAQAKHLSIVQLQTAISYLNEVVKERENEARVLREIEELAASRGVTLRQLGLVYLSGEDETTREDTKKSDRPIKPKFKRFNPESMFFYTENGEFKMLITHTMKKVLLERGIDIIPYHKLSKSQKEQALKLVEQAMEVSKENFNAKVVVWNAYADKHGLDKLSPM